MFFLNIPFSKFLLKLSIRKSIQISCFILILFTFFNAKGQVNLTFSKGYVGVQDFNPINAAKNIKTFTSLGIARVSFEQTNDINGVIKIYLSNGATSTQAKNSVITLNGSLNWRERTMSNYEAFGFIFNAGQPTTSITFNGSTNSIVNGDTPNASSTLGVMAYASTLPLNENENRTVNPDPVGLVSDLNTEFANTPQPTLSIVDPSVTEGQNLVFNVTLTNAPTTKPQALTFTSAGTASSSGDYSTTYSFSNLVVNNNDGTINIPTGVSSFTVTVSTIDDAILENTETFILKIGTTSATANILDNELIPIITTAGVLKTFSTCSGCNVNPQSFSVAGQYLIADLNVAATNGFEVSLTSNSGYASSINISPRSGTISTTSIYVRLTNNANATVGGTLSITTEFASRTLTMTTNTNNAFNFDGINDKVIVADDNALDVTSNYTIEAWIKPTALTSNAGIITKGSNGFNLQLTSTGDYSGISFDGKSTSNGILTLNKWYHIAAVNNNGTRKIYINGIDQTLSGTASSTLVNSDPLTIGQDFSTTRYFSGNIDEVRIWNIARTSTEINNNLNVALTGNETNLVANYNFDQGVANGTNSTTTSLLNNSTNALSGTFSGVALTGNSSNFVDGFMPSITAIGNPTTLLISSTLSLTNSLSGGIWSSTNPSIASVNQNTGLVTGLTAGSATITYTICNKTASYSLTVILAPTLSSTSLNSFTYCSGCTVSPKSITVAGENLRSNVSITASTGFQISTTGTGVYSSTITLTPNAGTLTNTNIYVRLINNFTSTPTGTLTITSTNALSKTLTLTSNTDNSLSFDGINDVVRISNNDTLAITSNYTIEAWIKPTRFNEFAGIVSKYQTTGSNGYNLKLTGTDNFSGISFDGMSTSDDVLTLNNWYHVAGVNLNGTRKIYINGVEQAITGTPITTAINTDPIIIGQDLSSVGDRFFKGSIDEVRIWNTAKTANDISSNMSVALTGNEPGLVAYYNFDQGIANGTNTATTKLVNNTTNALAGTISGMTLTGNVSNFVEGFMPSITAADSITVLLKGKTLALSNILTSGVWSSTNTNVASVDNNGLVTAVTAGNVSITYSICGKTTAYNLEVSVITTSGTFTSFMGCFGIPSAAQSIVVNAVSLTNNLVVSAPAGYEVSNSSTGTYSSSISLTPTSGTISNTAVYVRLSSKAFNGDHGDLILSSGNAKAKVVPIGIASIRLVKKVKLKINSNAPDNRICSGVLTNVLFTANADNAGLSPVYQWKLNGVNVGSNSATYSNSSLNDRDIVSVILTSENTFCLGPVTSNSITISVYSIPATPTTITGINNLCAGSNAVYAVDGVRFAQGYEWIASGNLSKINTSNNLMNTLASKSQGIAAVKVRAVNFCGKSDYSNDYNVIISSTSGPKADFRIINNNICIGTGPINFIDSSILNETNNAPVISYSWNFGAGEELVNTQNTSRNYTSSGGHDVILQIQSQDNCLASITKSANVDRLSVSGTITTDDSIICVGSNTILSLINQYGSIQWMKKDSAATDWSIIKGATSDTLNTGNIYVNTDYKVEVKSGSCSAAISTPISIKVKVAPTLTITPPNPVSDTAKSFILPFVITSGNPNANILTDTGAYRMPNFNNNIWYALRESPLKVLLPPFFNKKSVKGIYGFKISAVELPYCLDADQSLTFSLWVGIPKLIYNSPNVFKVGDTVKPLIPETENLKDLSPYTTFSIDPILPAGLTIDAKSGTINGIPSAVSSPTTYVVSATVSSSTITASVVISVIEDKPDSLKYTTPNVFVLGAPINVLTPTSKGGKIRTYSINKTLPIGLTLNTSSGVISGTPSGISSKTSYVVTGTNSAGTVTSTVIITVATRPTPPIVQSKRLIFGEPGLPYNLSAFVSPMPTGIVPVWCTMGTQNCSTTPPLTPTVIGKYIYQLRAYDTANQLYSSLFVNDTLIIAPKAPTVTDSTYLIGLKTNPANIGLQVSGLKEASFNYYNNGLKQSTIPILGNTNGTKKYAVSQTVNSIESDTVNVNVTLLDPLKMIYLQKTVDSGILQSNLSYNFPFKLILTNLTDISFTNVEITDDLQKFVPISSEFKVLKNTASGGLKANKYFDGKNNIKLTLDSSTLAPFAKDTLVFVMNLEPKGFSGTIKNVAEVKATTKWGTISVESSLLMKANETTKTPTTYDIKELKINIPEGFSPNNDGINDFFIIIKPFNIKIDIEIYNRSGKIVYSKKNYTNNWNGKGNGNYSERDLDDDGYYYSIKATDESGRVQVFKGFVLIQR